MNTPSTSASSDLDAFVHTAKTRAVPDDALVALLKQNGWSERRVYRSLADYYAETLGMAPPSRSARGDNARDAFLYLLNFITLGFWTTALGELLYTLIAHTYPNALAPVPDQLSVTEISWQLATIIVALPVFALLNLTIERELRRRPDFADSGVRLWLTYIALVVAAVIVLGDGVWFLQSFLRGEITTRFVLDSLVLFVIGGGVFAYYFAGLRARKGEA
jgi:hypothetical protein